MSDKKEVKVIQASWLDDENSWCEYCATNNIKRTYLPFHSNVLNPERICLVCVTASEIANFKIVDFFTKESDYREALSELKGKSNDC